MAMNPAVQPASVEAPVTQAAASQATAKPAAATSASDTLKIVAPVSLSSPDNAPLVAQLAALQQAQDAPTTSTLGFDVTTVAVVEHLDPARTIGIDLPRVSGAMANEGTPITDRNSLTEGDLVFFGRRGHVNHVGIYIGDGKFLHAPRTGRDVTVSTLTDGYWGQKYLEARRITTGG